MSIHVFSETAFYDSVKEILIKDSLISDRSTKTAIKNPDAIKTDVSLRENYDFSSLDIAELVIALEQKYGVNMGWAEPNRIDSLNDIYKLFLKSMQKTRKQKTYNYKTKTKATNMSVNENILKHPNPKIFQTVKTIVLEQAAEKKGYISPDSINAGTSLKYDLGLDSLDNMEVVMEFEKQLGVNIPDTTELLKKHSLGEFCYILHKQMNKKDKKIVIIPMNKKDIQDKQDVFDIVYKYLYQQHDIPFTNIKSNIYKDLGFSEAERCDFYEWAETQFDVKLPSLYFENLDELCKAIYCEMQKNKIKNAFAGRIKQIFSHNK